MSDDLIANLRLLESGARWVCAETADTLEDAADEIERLRATLREIAADCEDALAMLSALRAERDRLREAILDTAPHDAGLVPMRLRLLAKGAPAHD